jgi:hypothetical protein
MRSIVVERKAAVAAAAAASRESPRRTVLDRILDKSGTAGGDTMSMQTMV